MSINLKKNAREIGRHLRNRKWEATPGGILIDRGGMNALVNGVFEDTLYRDGGADRQISPNLVVSQGLIHVLNTVFAGAAQVTQWYIGLLSGNVTPQPNWTAANVVAKSTELTSYPTERPNFTVAAVAAPSIGNTGNEATFAFDASGPYIARGAFLISVSNKGSTTGVLMAATRFAADRAGLNSPDQLGVRYVLTAADAGP